MPHTSCSSLLYPLLLVWYAGLQYSPSLGAVNIISGSFFSGRWVIYAEFRRRRWLSHALTRSVCLGAAQWRPLSGDGFYWLTAAARLASASRM